MFLDSRRIIDTQLIEGVADEVGQFQWADRQVPDVERAEVEDDWSVLDLLQHVAFADPDADITLLERLLRSPDISEDLVFLEVLEPLFEQEFPDFLEYWEPSTELDYKVTFTDDQLDRLYAVLGETVHPARLRDLDSQFEFDLRRAADEYGPESTE